MKKAFFAIGLLILVLAMNSCTTESTSDVEKNYKAIEKGKEPPINGVDKGTPPPPNG